MVANPRIISIPDNARIGLLSSILEALKLDEEEQLSDTASWHDL
jgi:hypothetical protein